MLDVRLNEYTTLVFDCDGVVLNSNEIKTKAFYQTAKCYGEDVAQELVDYHVNNGGISRYKKFEYFIATLLKKQVEQQELQGLLASFAKAVKEGLMACEIAGGLNELRRKTKQARWLIVSGGDQSELRSVFAARDLDYLFDGGIFGSPDTKEVILRREKSNGNITKQALFLGDSQYDHQSSSQAGLDFLFVSAWSEWVDPENGMNTISVLSDLT